MSNLDFDNPEGGRDMTESSRGFEIYEERKRE
jgi:hypothetical protein